MRKCSTIHVHLLIRPSPPLAQATSMARYMVTECGFDDTVGPVYVGESGNGASEELKQRIDDRVSVGEYAGQLSPRSLLLA